ncbi:MAG TPA: hypothetical protein VKA36_10340 [Solirubrobacterales bacterium]|nr:hypothetical protein [Solirubrobacterales bacterium]
MSDQGKSERDVGHAIHYSAVPEGTAVYATDDVEVGRVEQVVDNYREHILDGIVITDTEGVVRFVDGPEVTRTFERAVFLSISAEEVAEHGPPEDGPGVFSPGRAAGRLGKLFGGGWKKR